jgi:cell division protein ZapA (FtsZ GTPase activity inhibitor)
MGADLYESYCGSILATAALGVAAFYGQPEMQLAALLLPMSIAGVGIFLSIAGMYMIRTDEDATQKNLLAALARGINISTVLVIVAAFGLTYMILGQDRIGVAGSVVVGLVAGWLIGKWTEYSTSDEYKPTKELAAQALTGPATVIIGGVAEGMISTWFPVVVDPPTSSHRGTHRTRATRAVRVTVAGQEYGLRSDADADYIRELAGRVDARIRDVQSGRRVVELGQAAVLVALQLADELEREKHRMAELRERLRDEALRLDRQLATIAQAVANDGSAEAVEPVEREPRTTASSALDLRTESPDPLDAHDLSGR